jgi:adenylate cyclase
MAVVVILLRLTGILEPLEWSVYDQYMRLRPPEPPDERIVIVGLDEADMKYIGQGYVPDGVYADLLQKLIAMQPRAIGLDIYRKQ